MKIKDLIPYLPRNYDDGGFDVKVCCKSGFPFLGECYDAFRLPDNQNEFERNAKHICQVESIEELYGANILKISGAGRGGTRELPIRW